jgi:hypothetical protein
MLTRPYPAYQTHFSTSTNPHHFQEPQNNIYQMRLPASSQVPAIQIPRITNDDLQRPEVRDRSQSIANNRPGLQMQTRFRFSRISDIIFSVHHGVYLSGAYRVPAHWHEHRSEDSDGAEVEEHKRICRVEERYRFMVSGIRQLAAAGDNGTSGACLHLSTGN